jgi:AcrR family transcriptional regulator
MTTPRSASTRDAILDAAECLFAEHGHDSTSMRQITRAAHVNLSAVNYHFGSKESLVVAVFQRRIEALNAERIRLLDDLEASSTGAPVPPSAIVEAYFGPLVRHVCRSGARRRAFMPLQNLVMSDPAGAISAVFAAERADVTRRFVCALRGSLPDIPENEVIRRFHYMLGAAVYAIMGAERPDPVADAPDAPDAVDAAGRRAEGQLLEQLLPFLLGGLCAPVPLGTPGSGGHGFQHITGGRPS